jgi:hypothetical protein
MPSSQQLVLTGASAAAAVGDEEPGTDHGEVFTRRWVVDMILDLAGYTADRDLGALRLVEPSCGTGAFLVPIVERLLASCRAFGRDVTALNAAVCSLDLLDANAALARKAVVRTLCDRGVGCDEAERLGAAWCAGATSSCATTTSRAPTSSSGTPLRPSGERAQRDHGRLPAQLRDHAGTSGPVRRLHRAGTAAPRAQRHPLVHLRRPVDAQPVRGGSP